ncbi:MAG: amino acid ABC transporter substrate-binding protein [Thermodesulfobacteriota bacterium]
MRLWIRLIFPVIALVCLITGPAWGDDPIRIGVSIALSGKYAPMGRMYADGLRLWAKNQNTKGGILGRPVDLTIHDDRGEPDSAVKLYREMLSSGRFDFVFGPYSSVISKAVVPLLEEYRYPTLLPLASVESVWDSGGRYVFGVTTPERRWTKAIFGVMARSRIDRLVILVDESLLRLGCPKDAEKWAGRFGLNILFLECLNKQAPAEQLRRARDAGAQALLVWGYLDDAVAVRGALAKIGWTPRVYFSQFGPSMDEYGKVLGELANYSLACGIWDPKIGRSYPGGTEFLGSFYQEYKRHPSYHAAIGYAAGVILSEAISRTGDTDREKIREVLSNLDTVTLVGRYGVDEKGVQIRQQPIIYQWQNGRKEVIWPEPLSTSQLQFPPETEP